MTNMWFFNFMENAFPFIFIGVFLFIVGIFIWGMVVSFSPKARAKMMGRQVKAVKYMVDDNKEEIEDLNDFGSDLAANTIRKGARALKEGFYDDADQVFCKYCGKAIDKDSRYCTHCGERQ